MERLVSSSNGQDKTTLDMRSSSGDTSSHRDRNELNVIGRPPAKAFICPTKEEKSVKSLEIFLGRQRGRPTTMNVDRRGFFKRTSHDSVVQALEVISACRPCDSAVNLMVYSSEGGQCR